MTTLIKGHNDNDIVERVMPRQKLPIRQLEAALKQRIGWVDEVISPFAQGKQQNRPARQAKSITR